MENSAHRADERRNTPLRGGYLAPYPIVGYLLGLLDWICGVLPFRVSRTELASKNIRKILLSNTAHLGDVLIASSVLPALKAGFPGIEIGIVVGSWAANLVKDTPGIAHVHVVDHWKLNRGPGSRLAKMRRYVVTRRAALQEIRAMRYDVAIDLYFYFPNSAVLFWQADIPARIGFRTGGFGNLYTHPVDWQFDESHVVYQYAKALEPLNIDPTWVNEARPQIEQNARLLQSAGRARRKSYRVVVHMGTGDSRKEWQPEKWRELIGLLLATGQIEVHFSGASANETAAINQVIRDLDYCENWSEKLSWQEFVALVGSADLLVGVDSVAGHVASGVKTPSVIVAAAMGNLNHWRPLGANVQVLTFAVACAPCYKGNGCVDMTCVRNVSVVDVFRACVETLGLNPTKMAS